MQDQINNAVTAILACSPAVMLLIVLNGVGALMKRIPSIPNWTIPIVLFLGGAVAYPFVGEYSATIKAAKFPGALMVLYGCGIGFAAVGVFESGKTLLERFWPSTPTPASPTPPAP